MFDDDTEEQRARRVFSRRTLLIGLGQLGLAGIVTSRLYDVQVRDAARYAPLADGNRMSLQIIAPRRGRIVDRAGRLVAGNDETFRVVLMPISDHDPRPALKLMSRVLPLPQAEIERIAKRAARSGPSTPIVVAGDISFQQVAQLGLLAPQLPGIQVEPAYRRRYPEGAAMGHVVGYVGAVETLAMDDDPSLRAPGMKVGKLGIERGMDAKLRGRGGSHRLEVDAKGRVQRRLEDAPPDHGSDIALTIDVALQKRVMQRLAREVRAAAVVMEVTRGEVLAMASHPGFDPALAAEGVSAPMWRRVMAASHRPLVDRAATGQYPPGSTFKMVTALAALDAGVINLKDRLPCDGSYNLGDRTFRCWSRSGHGSSDLHRALRESCDCYFYEAAHRTGVDRLAQMARKLGFGQTFPCGLAPQRAGLVPDPDWKRGRFGKPWTGGETLLAGIGQGYVLATPLQLCVMTARLATGREVVPTLVDAASLGNEQLSFPPLQVEEAHLEVVRKGMWAVVNEEGGTGSNAYVESAEFTVAGKTGTSQVARLSSERQNGELPWDKRDHALFVCYLPAMKPRYAISVVVEHGGGGGAIAAPLARDLVQLLIDDDPLARAPTPMRNSAGAAPGRERG